MDISYDTLSVMTDAELSDIISDANTELTNLQVAPNDEKITYWSTLSAMCNSILKGRKNG